MKASQKTIKLYDKFVLGNYTKLPCVIVKGQGIKVWDAEGKEYTDFFSGWGVSGLGHCPAQVVRAVRRQASKLMHVPNNFYNTEQGKLARLIIKHSFPGKVFFCNSGAEAVEAAIKLARRWQKGRFEIISMRSSFHGRTMGAITATAQPDYHAGFEPMLEGFRYALLNDIESVRAQITPKTSAILLETVQGEGGIHAVREDFIEGIKMLCKKHNLLLMLDEVQCGMGRTGKMFAYQHYNIKPDVMTLAKSLGGGVAIGAAVISNKVKDVLGPGTHASTFGGNPLACTAGIAVIRSIEKNRLLDHVEKMGKVLEEHLEALRGKYPRVICEVRGMGLMRGVELTREGAGIVSACFREGLMINCTQKTVLRLMPPFCVSKNDIEAAMQILEKAIKNEAEKQ